MVSPIGIKLVDSRAGIKIKAVSESAGNKNIPAPVYVYTVPKATINAT